MIDVGSSALGKELSFMWREGYCRSSIDARQTNYRELSNAARQCGQESLTRTSDALKKFMSEGLT